VIRTIKYAAFKISYGFFYQNSNICINVFQSASLFLDVHNSGIGTSRGNE